MKLIAAALLFIIGSAPGCIDELGGQAECYPNIRSVGAPVSGMLTLDRFTNLTHPAPWDFEATHNCGDTYWMVERVDGDTDFYQGLTLDLMPHEVASYTISLVVLEDGSPIVKHSLDVTSVEDRTQEDRIPFAAGMTDVSVDVPVGCCLSDMYVSIVANTAPANAADEWIRVTDGAGEIVATGGQTIRRGSLNDPGWADGTKAGIWTIEVDRSDPFSPYFNQPVELAIGISAESAGRREPGELAPDPRQ